MSSLSIITACVKRSVFGPDKFISNVDVVFGGRESARDMDKFMQHSLRIKDFLSEVIEDGERAINRSDVGNELFPFSKVSELEKRFVATWGQLVLLMLNRLSPYKSHTAALKEMYDGWATGDSVGLLAKDAIFEGVGMYWTLKDSYEHWAKRNEIRSQDKKPPLPRTDVVKAWEEIERKRDEFSQIRARYFLGGKVTDETTKLSDECFKVFNTHACQLGFVLCVTTVLHKGKYSLDDIPMLSAILVDAANSALTGAVKSKKFGRRTLLARGEDHPVNTIRKLDTPLAAYFRYFWLELLATKEAQEVYSHHIQPSLVEAFRDKAREFYYEYLIVERVKALKNSNPGKLDSWLKDKATATIKDEFCKSLERWFGVTSQEYKTWLGSISPATISAPVAEPIAEVSDEEGGEELASPPNGETVDEILNSLDSNQ